MGVFIEISDSVVPVVQQTAQTFVPQAWVPQGAAAVVPSPTDLTATPVADGVIVSWVLGATRLTTIVESGPSSSGPWTVAARSGDTTVTIGLTAAAYIRATHESNGIQSAPTNAILATPMEAASTGDVAAAVDTAAVDATTKANQAKTDAISAAAADAQAKANAARDAAVSQAATSAAGIYATQTALLAETNNRNTAITNKATELVNDYTAKFTTERNTTVAEIQAEANARGGAIAQAKTDVLQIVESADSAMSERINQISAGAGEMFDPIKVWHFSENTEGWRFMVDNQYATAAAENGYLKGTPAGNDPIFDRGNIDIDANEYRQIKLKIKRYGNPSWQGYIYGADSVSWRLFGIISEPTFDADGDATIDLKDIEWSGTVEYIRIDLAWAHTATDYFTIDWIAVGRPTPAAGVAFVNRVEQASINRDQAEALARSQMAVQFNTDLGQTNAAITNLQQTTSDANSARAQEIANLQAENQTQSGNISTAFNRLASVESVADEAKQTNISQGQLIDALDSRVENTETQQSTQAGFIDALNTRAQQIEGVNQSQAQKLEQLDASNTDLANDIATRATKSELTTVESNLNTLTGEVSTVSQTITQHAAEIASVDGKATNTANALSATQTTVSEQGGVLSNHASELYRLGGEIVNEHNRINSAFNEISDVRTDVNTVTGDVSTLSGTVAQHAASIAGVDGKATNTANALDATNVIVSQQGDTLSNQAQQINSLQTAQETANGRIDAHNTRIGTTETNVNTLTGEVSGLASTVAAQGVTLDEKASSSYVQGIANTVSEQGGVIAGHSSNLQQLNSTVFDATRGVTALGNAVDETRIDITAIQSRGIGANIVPSSDFGEGDGWTTAWGEVTTTWNLNNAPANLQPPGVNVYWAQIPGNPVGWMQERQSPPFAIEGGKRYCWQARAWAERANAYIVVELFKKDGTYLTEFGGPDSELLAFDAQRLNGIQQPFGFFDAPANAATAVIFYRPKCTGQSWPYVGFTQPMVSEATATQTQPPPYASGTLSPQIAATVSQLNALKLRMPAGNGTVADASIVNQQMIDMKQELDGDIAAVVSDTEAMDLQINGQSGLIVTQSELSNRTGELEATKVEFLKVGDNVAGWRAATTDTFSSFQMQFDSIELLTGTNTGVSITKTKMDRVFGNAAFYEGDPFGTDGLVFWIGPKSIAKSGATKANGTFWISSAGDRGGGAMIGKFGTSRATATSSTPNGTVEVSTGNFERSSSNAQITVSVGMFAFRTSSGSGTNSTTAQSVSGVIEKSVDGGAWTQVGGWSARGSYDIEYDSGIKFETSEVSGGGYAADTTSGTNIAYRARRTGGSVNLVSGVYNNMTISITVEQV